MSLLRWRRICGEVTIQHSKNAPNGSFDDDDLLEVERWAFKGLRAARDSAYDSQTGRATGWGTAIPVYAPALDAVADFNEGNYSGAALNTAFAIGDLLPMTSAAKILNLARKIGWDNLTKTDAGYRRMRKILKDAGYVKDGQEVHHIAPLQGASRTAQNWRNNPLLLKPMPQAEHRRLHGRWADEPRYEHLGKAWHGTMHWQKSLPVGAGTYAADAVENRVRRSSSDK